MTVVAQGLLFPSPETESRAVPHLLVLSPLAYPALRLIQFILRFVLALVALRRCEKSDVPAVTRALGSWWHRPRRPRR
jgi:hypothetical protein